VTTPSASAVYLPPINKRDHIPQAAIDDVVRQIAEKFKLIKVILFGSYAYGTPRRESDVDLLVIMESSLKENALSLAIRKAIDYHFGLDLIVKTPRSLAKRIELGDFFLKEILQRGKVLYEQASG